jgi:hypothetical protein
MAHAGVTYVSSTGQLQGLRELRAFTAGQQQLEALVAAVGSQLLALTVTTDRRHQRSDCEVQLRPLLTGMPQLTSLEILNETGDELNMQQDLPTVTRNLTALKEFSYTGRIHSAGSWRYDQPEDMCCPDYDTVIVKRGRAVDLRPGMLPPTLQGLTIIAEQNTSGTGRNIAGIYTLYPHALPESLTSLRGAEASAGSGHQTVMSLLRRQICELAGSKCLLACSVWSLRCRGSRMCRGKSGG